MKATITPHGIVSEGGKYYELLGSGERYGYDSVYAVRAAGEVNSTPIPAHTLPWPWNDQEIEIEIESALASVGKGEV